MCLHLFSLLFCHFLPSRCSFPITILLFLVKRHIKNYYNLPLNISNLFTIIMTSYSTLLNGWTSLSRNFSFDLLPSFSPFRIQELGQRYIILVSYILYNGQKNEFLFSLSLVFRLHFRLGSDDLIFHQSQIIHK